MKKKILISALSLGLVLGTANGANASATAPTANSAKNVNTATNNPNGAADQGTIVIGGGNAAENTANTTTNTNSKEVKPAGQETRIVGGDNKEANKAETTSIDSKEVKPAGQETRIVGGDNKDANTAETKDTATNNANGAADQGTIVIGDKKEGENTEGQAAPAGQNVTTGPKGQALETVANVKDGSTAKDENEANMDQSKEATEAGSENAGATAVTSGPKGQELETVANPVSNDDNTKPAMSQAETTNATGDRVAGANPKTGAYDAYAVMNILTTASAAYLLSKKR